MKPGREIARFEHRVELGKVVHAYTVSLREDGSTLSRIQNLATPNVIPRWQQVRGWRVKFKTLEGARAYYLERHYLELPVTGSAQI